MAVLQKIRNKAGLLIGVLGLALLAFVLSDLFSSSNNLLRKFQDRAFSVDGDAVSTGDYQKRIEQYEVFHEFLYGSNKSNENFAVESREKVYRDMIEEMAIDKEADKLGLSVTPDELSELVYSSNISSVFMVDQDIARMFANPQTGQFDQTILTNFLAFIQDNTPVSSPEQRMQKETAKIAWAYVNNKIKYQRLKEKYSALIGGVLFPNEEEAKAAHNDSKYNADFLYVTQPYSALPDSSVSVSDSEMKALYDKRRKNFKLDSELRTISYYIKDVTPSDKDYAIVENQMNTAVEKLKAATNPAAIVGEYSSTPYYDVYIANTALPADVKNFIQSANVGDVFGPMRQGQSYVAYKYVDKTVAPDSIYIQQMPMPMGLEPGVVNTIADSLITVVKKGKDFEVVARELWPEAGDGLSAWVTEIQLSQININKQCFAAAKGDILKLPINGQTWLIRIADKKPAVPKVKVASIIIPVIVSDETQNSIDNELNQFISEYGNIQDFNKGAESKGYALMPNVTISPSNMNLQNVPNTRSVIHWAFNNKVGEINKFDLTDKRVVAIITGKIEGDYLPLSEPTVNMIIKDELIKDKKAEKMIADLKSKNLTSLDQYVQAMNGKEDSVKFVSFQTRGSEPLLNVYSKVGQANKFEAPLKGQTGVYALYITNKTEDAKEYNADLMKMQLAQESNYILRQSALYVLREKMNIVDNRVKFW